VTEPPKRQRRESRTIGGSIAAFFRDLLVETLGAVFSFILCAALVVGGVALAFDLSLMAALGLSVIVAIAALAIWYFGDV
jgi:hypothetical protein